MNSFRIFFVIAACALSAFAVYAQTIVNPGFEEGASGWTLASEGAALNKDARTGKGAVKFSSEGSTADQQIEVTPDTHYELTARIKGSGLLGVKVGGRIYFDRLPSSRSWKPLTVRFNTGDATTATVFASYNSAPGSFDDFEIVSKGPQGSQATSPNVVSKSAGGTGLSPELPPGGNFDLLGWHLTLPTDTNNDGKADRIDEVDLAKGYQHPQYFFTGPDGGMVMRVPVAGAKTSANTSYTRTELREMLRRGNKAISTRNEDGTPNANNWAFSSAPEAARRKAGAVDGVLEATLAINKVTTTGNANEVGRVIIGQIHAKDDEPIRLYYRKLPGNTRGSIYAAHESKNAADDIYFELIGSRSQSAPDPENGFALDEVFSYRIEAKGNTLLVSILQDGVQRATATIDMSQSGYDVADDYMYFKAGVYSQDKSGDDDDYAQATFYRLKATH